MNTTEVKKMFVKEFYKPTYKSWRVLEERAGKDIVGAEYEKYREKFYTKLGFTVTSGKKVFGTNYDCDTAVELNGKTVILEEDKAHYLDSCFLERALAGFAKTVNSYLKNNQEVPCIILHSFTSYSKYEVKLNEFCEILRDDIAHLMREKIVYITLCERDRLPTKKWFQNCDYAYIDNVHDDFINRDISFIKSFTAHH